MPNPPETQQRSAELIAAKERLLRELLKVPGVNGVGIGLTRAARARHDGAENVRPEDLVIRINFESRSLMSRAQTRLAEILGDIPWEAEYVGIVRAL